MATRSLWKFVQRERLSRMWSFVETALRSSPLRPGSGPLHIPEVDQFGSNPGNLRMRLFVPPGRARTRPLVVVLHGCRQSVEGYDLGAGWCDLSICHDFMVLYPAQQPANNPRCCFSWFEPGDTRRGHGEVESIRQMVATAINRFGADPTHIFVCGLSAGGAMAGAMLATYPEVFQGGAVIAGLPYGTAGNLSEAYESMSAGKIRDAKAWGDLVRNASPHTGPWPSISIWHGTADTVVKPINAGELVKQWTNVHDVGADIPAEDHIGKISRRVWGDGRGRDLVIEYTIPGLGHGAPIDARDTPAPFFVPADISSTWQIAFDWRLTGRSRARPLGALFGLAPAATAQAPALPQAAALTPRR